MLFRNADCYDDHESQSLLSPYSAGCSVLQGRDKRGINDVDGACIREREIDIEIILSFREASLRFSRQHKYSITSAFPSRSAASWLCWAPISTREVLENPISLGPELIDVKRGNLVGGFLLLPGMRPGCVPKGTFTTEIPGVSLTCSGLRVFC